MIRWRRRSRSLPSESEMIDLLQRSRPIPAGELSPERIAAIAQAMREGRHTAESHSRFRRRGRTIGAGVIVAIIAGSGAVAWAVARHRPADNPLTIICHDDLRLDSSARAVQPDGAPAVELCARLWTDGTFGRGTAPPLIACAQSRGAAEVFPAKVPQACETLGLSPLLDETDAEQRAEQRLQDSLSDRLAELGCVDVDTLRDIVAEELEANGLESWAVTSSGEPAGELRCAVPTIDPLDNRIVIEFLPDIWTSTTHQGAS